MSTSSDLLKKLIVSLKNDLATIDSTEQFQINNILTNSGYDPSQLKNPRKFYQTFLIDLILAISPYNKECKSTPREESNIPISDALPTVENTTIDMSRYSGMITQLLPNVLAMIRNEMSQTNE
jgi:hypothetical protein